MGRFIGFLVLAIVVAGIGYSANYIRPFPWSSGSSEEPGSSSPLYADTDESTIHAQGRLEPKGGTISVSGLPGEQIVELLVQVGSPVKQGDELVVLGSKAIREAEVELATARQQQAAAQLESEKALSGPRIEAAQLAVQLAEARRKSYLRASC